MESLHRLGDELADLGAGTSPVRGVSVAAVALAVGIAIIVMGFDGRADQLGVQAADVSGATGADGATSEPNAGASPTGSETDDADIDEGVQVLPSIEETPEEEPTTTTESTSRPVQEVTLMVVNSKAPKGSAARLTSRLADEGYQTRSPSNADRAVPSAVYYMDGFGDEAQGLALVLGIGPEFVIQLDEASPPVNDRREANVLVVISSDGPIGIE